MPSYTLQNIADAMGVNRQTAFRQIKKLKEQELFQKSKRSKFISDREAEQLSNLLGFKLINLKAK